MGRRTFLRNASAAATVMAVPRFLLAAQQEKDRLRSIGIQLYTVRGLMDVDLPGTLAQLARIGYRELEFAGYYDYSSGDIRRILADTGLTSPSTHVSLELVRDKPEALIEYAADVGHDYLVVAWLPEHERQTLDQYRAHAALFSDFAERCRRADMQFAYHNHDFEFTALDGVLPMELLMAETDTALVQFEMDFFWVTKAGHDPLAWFARQPGRFPLCHVKDMDGAGEMVSVGAGDIDFAALFAASGQGGIKHFFVEHDNPPDALASASRSYEYVSQLRF